MLFAYYSSVYNIIATCLPKQIDVERDYFTSMTAIDVNV